MDIKDGKQAALSLLVFDAEGNLAAVDGAPVWASSDETLMTVAANADNPMAAEAVTVPGPGLGACTITATVDADLGEGFVPVAGSVDFNVVAGDAASVGVTVGEITDRPAPEPPAPEPVP